MKICPVCALDLEDTYLFCPDDGSNLARVQAGPSEIELTSTPEPRNKSASAAVLAVAHDSVVLYCPKCAAEYPLTFSDCPVHNIPLIKHRIPGWQGSSAEVSPAEVSPTEAVADREPAVEVLQQKRDQTKRPKRLTTIDLTRPSIERPKSAAAALMPTTAEHRPLEKDVVTKGTADFEEVTRPKRPTTIPFTRPSIERPKSTAAALMPTTAEHHTLKKDVVTEPTPDFEEVTRPKRLTTIPLTRPSIERPKSTAAAWMPTTAEHHPLEKDVVTEDPADFEEVTPFETVPSVITPFGYWEPQSDVHDRGPERPGFRVAAITTIIVLVALSVVAAYKVISHLSRKAPATSAKMASTEAAAQAPPFVATPKEAQDYKEQAPVQKVSTETEPPPQKVSTEPEPPPPHAVERAAIPHRSSVSPPEGRARPAESIRPVPKAPVERAAVPNRSSTSPPEGRARHAESIRPVPKASVERAAIPNRSSASPPEGRARYAKAPVATTSPVPETTKPPMHALPRGNSGGFDARLIRVRSMKTAAGVRYDLTFNMQEQAGRAALWQRVLISTRTASGISRSQAVPFSHRLGASGALTFTINIELTGRSEADWQGRVVCTALGWDNNGGPLQASFGATVAP